jgi:heptosyltransferase-1
MASVRRLLIIKLSAMGDVLHALPVSAALGQAFPQIELAWAVEEPFAPLLEGNPYLTEVFALPKLRPGKLRSPAYRRDYFGRLGAIRRRGFDLALDLQGLTKSALIAAASGAPTRLGYHWLREAARYIERPLPKRPESVHIVEQYLDTARFLGAQVEKAHFPLFIPESDAQAADALLCAEGIAPGAPFLSVNPAAGHPLKQWGIANYAALMDQAQARFGLPVALVTADRAVAEAVKAAARQPFADLSGRTSLKQLAAVLRRNAVHVCGDTGSGHLAAALERPVIALFGPTDPDRACPYGQRANALSFRAVCSPQCNWHHCVYSQPRCLAQITVETVLDRLAEALAQRRDSS